jgi:hypothetical protein
MSKTVFYPEARWRPDLPQPVTRRAPEHRPSYFRAIVKAILHEHALRDMRRNCRADRYISEDGEELAREP